LLKKRSIYYLTEITCQIVSNKQDGIEEVRDE